MGAKRAVGIFGFSGGPSRSQVKGPNPDFQRIKRGKVKRKTKLAGAVNGK